MKIGLWFSVVGCLASFSAVASTDSEMLFTTKPSFTSDSSGNFSGCGLILSTEKKPTRFSEGVGFAVKLTFTKKDYVNVQAANYTSSMQNRTWVPSPKIIKWIKVADGRPIALEPWNLIANKEAGLSEFSAKDAHWDTLVQIGKEDPTVWVEFYKDNERFQYSGVLKVDTNTYNQLAECISSLDKKY